METNQLHRETLIDRLNTVISDIERHNKLIRKFENEERKNEKLIPSIEVDMWLLERAKELIEKALITNELDNW